MPAVRSSNINSVEYNEELRELSVTFRSGATYTYGGVDEAAYQDLLTNPSPGSYFARHIKDKYPTRKGTG